MADDELITVYNGIEDTSLVFRISVNHGGRDYVAAIVIKPREIEQIPKSARLIEIGKQVMIPFGKPPEKKPEEPVKQSEVKQIFKSERLPEELEKKLAEKKKDKNKPEKEAKAK